MLAEDFVEDEHFVLARIRRPGELERAAVRAEPKRTSVAGTRLEQRNPARVMPFDERAGEPPLVAEACAKTHADRAIARDHAEHLQLVHQFSKVERALGMLQ